VRSDEARTESGRRVCVEPVANPPHDKGLTQGKPPMEATIKPAGRRRIVTLATALFVIMIVGIAYAAWTADGSGTGSADSGEAVSLTIDGTESVSDLFPGDEQDLDVEIVNPNPYNVTVQDITLALDNDEIDPQACVGNHDIALGSYTIAGDGLVVEGNGGNATVTLEQAVAMGHDSTDDCQDAEFVIDITLAGESSPEAPVASSSYAKN
jgi:hypothetical protein